MVVPTGPDAGETEVISIAWPLAAEVVSGDETVWESPVELTPQSSAIFARVWGPTTP